MGGREQFLDCKSIPAHLADIIASFSLEFNTQSKLSGKKKHGRSTTRFKKEKKKI